jgi:hypothetical protein
MKHASADVGLIFTCYNLRRIFNLIGKNQLKEYLKGLASMFLIFIGYFNTIRQLNCPNTSFYIFKFIQFKVV